MVFQGHIDPSHSWVVDKLTKMNNDWKHDHRKDQSYHYHIRVVVDRAVFPAVFRAVFRTVFRVVFHEVSHEVDHVVDHVDDHVVVHVVDHMDRIGDTVADICLLLCFRMVDDSDQKNHIRCHQMIHSRFR